MEHPVEAFRRRLTELRRYPAGVIPVPAYLRGTAFFSAAAGLVMHSLDGHLPPFPFGGVMFVGNNLDSETAFLRRLHSGQAHGDPERPMLTWRNLYRLLSAADVSPSDCFFTNAFVGLKAGDDPRGRFPGAGDPEFRIWCRRFLEEQIAVMGPAVVAYSRQRRSALRRQHGARTGGMGLQPEPAPGGGSGTARRPPPSGCRAAAPIGIPRVAASPVVRRIHGARS